jgi:hypothetical protein
MVSQCANPRCREPFIYHRMLQLGVRALKTSIETSSGEGGVIVHSLARI